MSPKRPKTDWTARLAMIGIPVVTFIGGMALNAYTIANNLATKPYVDQRHDDSIKYTDARMSYALEKAIDHSDRNRADLMSEIRSVAVKQDLIYEAVKDIRGGGKGR